MKSAIIGYGGMGSWHHSMIKERIPAIEVVGAYDIREERQEEIRKQGIHSYASLDELLADKSINLVTIATPNNFHKLYSIACMESGKNVVCEKPVAMNQEELKDMIKVSERTGKIFTIHQNRRWDKDYVIVKKIIEDNTIGKPYFIESRVQGSKRVLAGWRGYKINGGGMVFDWGVHLLDQIMMLIKSPVTEIYSQLFNLYSKEVDDNIKISLRFEDKTAALIEVSTNCFINQARWHMSCEDGSAVIDDWSCNGRMVKLVDDSETAWSDVIVYTEAGPTRTMAPRPRETTEELPLPEVQTDWADFYNNIVDTINGNAELVVKPAEALRVMQVIEGIFQSDKLGKSIQCRI